MLRMAHDGANFIQLFAQVQDEIPGSPIFIMKLVGNARHLEVQLLADQYSNTISLFGRDCSVQCGPIPKGYAIGCRTTAENPETGFKLSNHDNGMEL